MEKFAPYRGQLKIIMGKKIMTLKPRFGDINIIFKIKDIYLGSMIFFDSMPANDASVEDCVIFAMKDLKKMKKSTAVTNITDRVLKYGKTLEEVLSAIEHLVEAKVLMKVFLDFKVYGVLNFILSGGEKCSEDSASDFSTLSSSLSLECSI